MTTLTQAQRREAVDAIADRDPGLADLVAERLDRAPAEAAIERLAEHIDRMGSQTNQAIDRMSATVGMAMATTEEKRARSEKLLMGLVGLTLLLNTALTGISIGLRWQGAELAVTPSSVVAPEQHPPEPVPAPLASPPLFINREPS